MTREELEAVRNHISNLPTVGAMYASVLVEWVSVLLRQRDEVTAQRDNAVDASKEGAWMARALDAERERDEALAQVARRDREHEALLETAHKALAHVEAERDLLKNHYSPEAAAKLRAELASARAELAFLRKEYGEAESSTLTRDALELKLQVMEQQRNEECKQHDALRAVWIAARDWLNHLEQKGYRYNDGVPGELMDAVAAADDVMTGKP